MVTRAPVENSAAGTGETLRVNLRKLLDGDPAANLRLQNGDTVFFPKMTSFFVLGEVQRQGAYAMERETTVLEAITLAGGFTDRAAPRGAKILRKRADGPQTTIDVDLSGTDARAREMVLAEGDTLMVPRGNVFFVAGEVRKPGVYLLDGSTSAFGAITLAGGLTERAAPAQGKLIRRGAGGEEQTLVLDLSGADPRARDVPLKDGDTLLIPAGDLFFVLGEVNKPGAFPLVGATTVVDGVLLAGGFTSRAAESKVKVTRRLPTGEEQVMVLDLSVPNSRGRDIPLMAGDTVMIPTGTGATVYILGEVKSPGVFPLQDGATTMQAIALAGGFMPKAAESKVKVTRRLPTGEEQVIVLDLAGPNSRGRDFPLMAGDTVTVPTGTGSTRLRPRRGEEPGRVPVPGRRDDDPGDRARRRVHGPGRPEPGPDHPDPRGRQAGDPGDGRQRHHQARPEGQGRAARGQRRDRRSGELVLTGDGRMDAIARSLLGLLCLALAVGSAIPAESETFPYLVGPGDVLKVTVWGHDNLSRADAVSPQGTLPFPLIGEVPVAGLTAAQVEARIRELLDRDYIVDPRVSVAVQEYRSQKVFVLGEVAKPGVYPLTGATSLLDVLSQAGGQTAAAGGSLLVTRAPAANGAAPAAAGEVLRVNVKKLLDGDPASNLRLQNGDTVFFPRLATFFVLGEVQRQGGFALERETTVLDAISLAGGLTGRAAPRSAKILRKQLDGPLTTIELDLSGADPRAREVPLKDGDTLLIPAGDLFFVLGRGREARGLPPRGRHHRHRRRPARGRVHAQGGGEQGEGDPAAPDGRGAGHGPRPLGGQRPRPRPAAHGRRHRDGADGQRRHGLRPRRGEEPGAFPLQDGATTIQAIALAGGFTDRAAAGRVRIIRTREDGKQEILVMDANDIIKRGRKDKDVPLAANDVVVVPESLF